MRKIPDCLEIRRQITDDDETKKKKKTKKEKQNDKKKIKQVILSAINLLIHSDTLDNAAEIFKNIRIVFGLPHEAANYSEAWDSIQKTDTLPKDAQDLKEKYAMNFNDEIGDDEAAQEIAQDDNEQTSLKEDDVQFDDTENIHMIKKLHFYIFFNEIRQEMVKNTILTEVLNKFYLPKFIEYLFTFLLPYFPLWSSIVLLRLGIRHDSNAPIETNWGLIKNNILQGKRNISAQVYIKEIEPFISADIVRRKISLKRISRRVEKIPDIDPSAFNEEKWVKRNYHLKGKKVLQISTATQTDDNSIDIMDACDNILEYNSSKFETCNRLDKISMNNNEKSTGTYNFANDDWKMKEIVNISTTEMEDFNLENVPDIFRADINYPSGFPNLKKSNIDGIIIDRASWATLRANKCLNDIIINSFLIMMSKSADTTSQLKVVPFDSLMAECLLSDNGLSPGYCSKLASLNVMQADICLMPINTMDIHWSLFIMVPKKKKFIYIDSLKWKMDEKLMPRFCGAIKSIVVKVLKIPKPKWSEWTCIESIDHPSQIDSSNSSNNCGIHVCVWMYIICTGSCVSFHENQMNNVRKVIACVLDKKIIPKKPAGIRNHNVPVVKKSSKTAEKLRYQSEPPEGYTSTLHYCSSLVSILSNKSTFSEKNDKFNESNFEYSSSESDEEESQENFRKYDKRIER